MIQATKHLFAIFQRKWEKTSDANKQHQQELCKEKMTNKRMKSKKLKETISSRKKKIKKSKDNNKNSNIIIGNESIENSDFDMLY